MRTILMQLVQQLKAFLHICQENIKALLAVSLSLLLSQATQLKFSVDFHLPIIPFHISNISAFS